MSCSPCTIIISASPGTTSATARPMAPQVGTTPNTGGAYVPSAYFGFGSLVAAAYALARSGSITSVVSSYVVPSFSRGRAMAARYKDRMTTRILLVRHGESEWNASGRWQGWAGSPLSDRGRRQALRAASAVGAVDAIVTSDLERAVQTALIVSEAIGVGPVVTEPGLRERNVGDWTGRTRDEIEARWPGDLDRWRRGELPEPPGGERNDEILERVEAALRRVASTFD